MVRAGRATHAARRTTTRRMRRACMATRSYCRVLSMSRSRNSAVIPHQPQRASKATERARTRLDTHTTERGGDGSIAHFFGHLFLINCRKYLGQS